MIRMAVEKLKEGQVLAQDVTRQDGVVLMTRGTEITSVVRNMLSRLEIDSVVVEGDLFANEEERQDFLAQQEKELQRRFSRVENDPLLMGMRELFRRRLHQGCFPRSRLGGDQVVDTVEKLMPPKNGS